MVRYGLELHSRETYDEVTGMSGTLTLAIRQLT